DSMTVVFVFAVNLLWFRPIAGTTNDLTDVRQLGWLLVGLLAIGIMALVWFRLKSQTIIGWIEARFNKWPRLPGRLKRGVLSLLDQLARALRILANARDLSVTIGWTVLLWGSI